MAVFARNRAPGVSRRAVRTGSLSIVVAFLAHHGAGLAMTDMIFSNSVTTKPVAVRSPTLPSPRTLSATASTLAQVLQSARGGDRIVLSGNFGFMKLYGMNYSSTVTIDASAARFTDTMVIYGANNVAFSGGTFGSGLAVPRWGRAIQVYNSTNIGFDQAQFVGFGGNGAGINFQNVQGAYVANSTFSNMAVAGSFDRVNGGTILNNMVYGQTKDGFDIVGSKNVKASHNSCLGAKPMSGAHPDCIQIWSLGDNNLSSNIEISDNLSYGDSQGFTKFRTGGAGFSISILRNVVESTFPQGIACYDCSNSVISDNFFVKLKSAAHFVNLNVIGGTNNRISGNTWSYAPSDAFVPPPGSSALAGVLAGGLHAAVPSLATTAITNIRQAAAIATVPEPSIWGSLIAGFGLQGGMMRRRRRPRLSIVAD